jgi:hypothetical protein
LARLLPRSRYVEDPLADFVQGSEVPAGSTVMVEPAPKDDPQERHVMLTVIEPKPALTPVGVGAEAESEAGGEPAPEVPDAPPPLEPQGDEPSGDE